MFTGLIETTGTVLSLERAESGAPRLSIAAPALAGRWKAGDSIAVNGVCLTAVDTEAERGERPERFSADLAAETVARTTLTRLAPGSLVNLELPTPAGTPLGGHVVQGHVDGTGKLVALTPLQPGSERTDWRLTIEAPAALAPHIIQQGSITVDGISLTVARLHPRGADGSVEMEIAIIPHTFQATHLHTLRPGAEVNLETDVLARYAVQQQQTAAQDTVGSGITAASLIANGF